MNYLELLSPAKNLQCGISDIDHGADAVYIGAARYGARAAAGNSIEDIEQLCRYAHQYDAKVYVTVNTIIYDEEMDDTLQMVKRLNEIGVDAILVQDMGLLKRMVQEGSNASLVQNGLRMALHASTQTDNRTAEKVRWLHSLGFKRVVLARELSINEIRQIHEEVPEVELEVFVHGALCVSYSGQCYASQHCFGRSANRGECAQFCRMQFDLKDADGNTLEMQKHLLSLKDMAQIDNLERLAEAGAVSFKIEGRLKDVDYVKNITAAYSERLNEICKKHPEKYCRASMGRCTYTFEPNIQKSFNRSFTTYFANGRKQGMANFDTPKAIGEPVGRVKEIRLGRGNGAGSFNVATAMAFSNGDGLCFFNDNKEIVGFRINRAEGNRLFPLHMPEDLKPGTMLYRNHDQAFETLLGKPSAERKIEVRMTLRVSNDRLMLSMTDEHQNRYEAEAEYEYQKAQKPQEENIKRQLTKLGDTPFVCHDFEIDSEVEMPFIPNSQLGELRKKLRKVTTAKKEQTTPLHEPQTEPKAPSTTHAYLLNASNKKAIEFYKERGIDATSYEKGEGGELLMQCRYCLKHELGYCSKYTKTTPWKEPLSIRMSDGREFQLRFNCAKCQMEVLNGNGNGNGNHDKVQGDKVQSTKNIT
jgi:putative protease